MARPAGYPGGGQGRQGYDERSALSAGGDRDEVSSPSNASDVPGMGGPRIMHSHKVANLANDIEQLETKCNYLEQRNIWLTKRLLNSQRKFMERTLAGSSKVMVRRTFEGWRDALQELVLERQLDQQTASLDECQKVAKELGAALSQEQQARQQSEAQHRQMRVDLQRALDQEKKLKQQHADQARQLEILERRVHEAESCLVRSRSDAQAVIESANAYERRRSDMESEAKEASEQLRRKGPAAGQNPLEYSIKMREEAKGVMSQVSSLLTRPVSPGRDP